MNLVAATTLAAALFRGDGVSRFASPLGSPNPVDLSDVDSGFCMAFTPTGTTVSFAADGPITPTNATVRVYDSFGSAAGTPTPVFESLETLRFLRVWARRKPGATGTIAAQLIIVKSKASPVEIGRLRVGAAATGEPASDVVCLTAIADHANWALNGSDTLSFVFESADADLEVCVECYGKAA